jgi:hypothetical protein
MIKAGSSLEVDKSEDEAPTAGSRRPRSGGRRRLIGQAVNTVNESWGKPMTGSRGGYFLRWKGAGGEIAYPPVRFATRLDAMDAVGVLPIHQYTDIWIEDDAGSCVADKDAIFRQLRLR